jgi:signal transduction histidine kinase
LDEARKLEHLVAGILKAGHEVSADFQELDVHQLADASYEATREKARLAKVRLIKELQPVQPKIIGDKECLTMALKELILNAIEASSKHGQVVLMVNQENQWIVFTVQDQGKGIEKEQQSKIYDPLFSTKRLSSGLGLSFAKEIVEAHNGYIKFESEVGEESTFYLYLPASYQFSG